MRYVVAPAWKIDDLYAAVFAACFHFHFAQDANPYAAYHLTRKLFETRFARIADHDALKFHLDQMFPNIDWFEKLCRSHLGPDDPANLAAFELLERVLPFEDDMDLSSAELIVLRSDRLAAFRGFDPNTNL